MARCGIHEALKLGRLFSVLAAWVKGIGASQLCRRPFAFEASDVWEVVGDTPDLRALGLQVPSEKVGLGWVPGGSKYFALPRAPSTS